MPGNDNAPDGYDDMLAELSNQDASSEAEQAGRDATHDALRPTGDAGNKGDQRDRLYANKYKSPEEMEKAHLGLRKGYDEKTTRVKSLEEVLSNPKLHALAKTDPEVRDALAKVGVQIAQNQEAAEEAGEDALPEESVEKWLETADGREAQRDAKFNLWMERQNFQEQLGRKLQPQEWNELSKIITEAPRLSLSRAWKLTDAYEKQAKAAEEKRFAEASKRGGPKRPAPRAPFAQGQSQNVSKNATELRSDQDKAAFISDILERNQ